jgi:hypothetical protein
MISEKFFNLRTKGKERLIVGKKERLKEVVK